MRTKESTDRSPIENWDAIWAAGSRLRRESPVVKQIMALYHGDVKERSILEVGAGSGRDIIALATRGAQAIALDRSAIARARILEEANAVGLSVRILSDDLRSISLPDRSLDVVYSQGVLEHFTDTDAVLQEQRRLVKAGGYLIVDVPQRWNPYTVYKHVRMLLKNWPPGWETEFSPGQLRRIGERNGLRVVSVYSSGENDGGIGRVLMPLNVSPWTAKCIGVVYSPKD